MTIETGREMHTARRRPRPDPVTPDAVTGGPSLAAGRAQYRAAHDPDTGRRTAARAALDEAAATAAAAAAAGAS